MATRKKASSSRASADVVSVDFSETESRGGKKKQGGRKHYPEGDYAVKVKNAELITSSEKNTPGIFLDMAFTEGKQKGKSITTRLWLAEGALWKVRAALEAMGVKVPSGRAKINAKKLVGKTCAITLEDDEYDGKMYSEVTDFFSEDELEDSDDEDDDDEEDDEDEDEEDDEDDEEDDDDEDDDEDLEEVDLDI